MVQQPRRSARGPFHHPEQDAFDYHLMLEAFAMCRREAERFKFACGVRNPAYREAEALVQQIDAVALLTRVAGAVERVKPAAPPDP